MWSTGSHLISQGINYLTSNMRREYSNDYFMKDCYQFNTKFDQPIKVEVNPVGWYQILWHCKYLSVSRGSCHPPAGSNYQHRKHPVQGLSSDWDRRQLEERHSWSWLRSGLIDVRIVGECQIMKIVSQQKPNVPKLQITNLVSAGCHIVTEGQYNSRAVLGKYSKIKISFFIQLKSSPLANAGSMRLKVWNWGRWWMGISF